MSTKAGDRIIVESEKVGKLPREGEILEVIKSSLGMRYRVRWADGHESTFRPSAGSATIISAQKGKPAQGSERGARPRSPKQSGRRSVT